MGSNWEVARVRVASVGVASVEGSRSLHANGSLKTGFTTNRFHSVSGSLENGTNRFETGQIFPKRAEKKPGFYPGKNGIFNSL